MGAHKDNLTGLKGVSPSRGRWSAQISIKGKQTNLGRFDTPEAAHAAYCRAAEHRGEFGRTA